MMSTAFVVSWAAMSRMGLGSLSQTVHCILINPLTIPHDVPLPSKNTSWQSPGLWHTTPCQSSIYIVAYGLLKKYNRESLSNSNKSHSANPKWSNGPWFWIRIGVLLTWNPHDQIVMFITTTNATYHHGGWASTWFKNSSYWQQGQLPSCSLFVEATQMTYLDNNSTYGWISEWGCFQGTCNLVVLILVYSEFKHNEQIQMLRFGELTICADHLPVWANYPAGQPIPQGTPRYRQKGWNWSRLRALCLALPLSLSSLATNTYTFGILWIGFCNSNKLQHHTKLMHSTCCSFWPSVNCQFFPSHPTLIYADFNYSS